MKYHGRSGLHQASGSRILQFAPNLARDEVAFDAPLLQPLQFREAISALHDVVINDLKYQPRDKTAYENWKQQQVANERQIRATAREEFRKELAAKGKQKPAPELKTAYAFHNQRYWKARRQLNNYLRKHDEALWRKLMPFDPVITVADDVVFFECFSTDESSYGCLTVDRDAGFGRDGGVSLGTTNVDYSWDLYDNFQSLRTYRATRFNINPEGLQVQTTGQADYHEEKIELPDGWLRGFMQLQAAMGLPMRKVSLSVSAMYSLLAFLKRNKAKTSPRAIRFELADGRSPRLILEPWEQAIESPSTIYSGPTDEPIRVWGRRRLLTLARLLPLAQRVDVYLLGTGLPSFWVVKMGSMRLTLGLSGWTANDWTRGSAVQMLLPHVQATDTLVASTAEALSNRRSGSLQELAQQTKSNLSESAASLNQLALRGQAIYDLDAEQFRWRQVLPMALSDREMGPPHPEIIGAQEILAKRQVSIGTREQTSRGMTVLAGKVAGKPCEAMVDGDGMIRKGKCVCSWHYKFGIRNGACRHIQALRDADNGGLTKTDGDWYLKLLQRAGRS
jgi:hypothetical protein